MQVGNQVNQDFVRSVNQVCNQVSHTVTDDQAEHIMFMLECARQQLRKHDPKARSYGIVAQLVCTAPKAW